MCAVQLLFEPDEDEGVRDGKLQLIQQYNALMNSVVHAEGEASGLPASPASELASPSSEQCTPAQPADVPALKEGSDFMCDGKEAAVAEYTLLSGGTSDLCGETQISGDRSYSFHL